MMHNKTRSDAYLVSGLRRPLAIEGYVQILELTSCLFIFRSHSRTRHVNLHKSLVTTRRPVTDFIRRGHTYQGGTYCQRIKDDLTSAATSNTNRDCFSTPRQPRTSYQCIVYSLRLPFPAIATVVYQGIRLANFMLIHLILIINAFLMRRPPLCVRLKALGLRVLTAKGV